MPTRVPCIARIEPLNRVVVVVINGAELQGLAGQATLAHLKIGTRPL